MAFDPLADGLEVPLLGGDVTEGLVRVGPSVRRPRGARAELIEQLLTYLEQVGFGGAPRFLGIDSRGRQSLSFVEGEVAERPWPNWVADDDRIISVARLVRAYDDAAEGFGVPASWRTSAQPEPPGTPVSIAGPATFIGHLDITPENVVFVDGVAHCLIDFDLARPTDRVSEVCNMLLWWAPLMPPDDREAAVREVDAIARATLLVDAYGLDAEGRGNVVATARNSADRAWFLMKHRAETMGGGWARMWNDGVGDRIIRRQHWLAEYAEQLDAAVRATSGQRRG